ncbi:unnamed protein product [Ectocarpus sp. 8 AP-2014]
MPTPPESNGSLHCSVGRHTASAMDCCCPLDRTNWSAVVAGGCFARWLARSNTVECFNVKTFDCSGSGGCPLWLFQGFFVTTPSGTQYAAQLDCTYSFKMSSYR